MTTKTYSFTAFAASDLLSGNPHEGFEFVQPAAASLTIDVADNDSHLSGDFLDRSLDFSGQTATISRGNDDQGNGGQIYAEREFHLQGDDGKSYTLIEIEQEGSSAKLYTYAGSVPPVGVTLSISDISNVGSVSYDQLGAGDLPQNIVDIAAGSDDFNILVKALSAAGLVDTVKGLDDITVFAPTDAAFTQLAVDLGFEGDTTDEDAVFGAIAATLTELGGGDPIPLLTDILLYHVSGGAKSAAEVDALEAVPTLLEGATFGSEGTELVDNEPDVANPNIVIPDITASNGTIQAIDRVLLPIDIPGNEAPNIVDIAAGSDDFNILVKALSAAGLVDTVKGLDDITVFAPTDAAFTQLAVGLGFEGDTADEDATFGYIVDALTLLSGGGDPIPLLTDILLYHVSGGAKSAAEVDELEVVPTLLEGATFGSEGTELVDNEPDVANPNIVIPDIGAANGTIQAIDGVLIPLDILQGDGGRGSVDFEIGSGANERFWTGSNTDFVSGLDGNDSISLGRGDDVGLGGDGNDKLNGGSGDDVLNGGDGRDKLNGGSGDDLLDGGDGRDRLNGSHGDDMLNGGAGKDVLVGGRGDDTLTGGADSDVFVFNRFSDEDTVTDFTVGEDFIKINMFGLRKFDQIADRIEDTADGALIDLGKAEITLQGVSAADLDKDDFWF